MAHAATYVGLVLLVGQRRRGVAHGMESVGLHVWLVGGGQQVLQLLSRAECHEIDHVVEMVEHDDVLEKDVEYVGRVVAFHGRVLHRYVLEIAHGVGRREAENAVVLAAFAFHVEAAQKLVHGLGYGQLWLVAVLCGYISLHLAAVGESHRQCPVRHSYARHGVYADEALGVFASVIVGTFHEHRLRIEVAQAHVEAHGRVEIAEQPFRCSVIIKTCHILLPCPCC